MRQYDWLIRLIREDRSRHDDLRPRRRRRSRRGPARSAVYRNFIRSLECCVCGRPPRSEAAHTGTDGGRGQKSSDFSAIPLCPECHTFGKFAYHRLGKAAWEAWHQINCAELVRELNRIWRER